MPDFTPIPEGFKQCGRKAECINPLGSILPATSEYCHRDKGHKDGLAGACKVCAVARSAKWNKTNPERRKENVHTSGIKRRPQRLVQKKKRYQRDRDRILAENTLWRINNREHHRALVRAWHQSHKVQDRVRGQKRRAKKRSLP